MLSFLSHLIGIDGRKGAAGARPGRQRLVFPENPSVIYAIGDVHGCLPLLHDVEDQIAADADPFEGEKWIVMLGDYIDRGPKSAQVLDHLLAPPPREFQRFCLAGNHEAAMLAFLDDPAGGDEWLDFGGVETLASYGISASAIDRTRRGSREFRNLMASHLPEEHLAFLANLPAMIETPGFVFVHAGLRPGTPLREQDERDLLWSANDFTETFAEFGKTIVHGHQSRAEPLLTPYRVALDTAAYASGRLTAARLSAGEDPRIFTATIVPARP